MSTLQLDMISLNQIEEERYAFEKWLEEKERQAIYEDAYWEEIVYGRVDREARERFFRENPREKFDSPDVEYEER